jgi:hypothetical protein
MGFKIEEEGRRENVQKEEGRREGRKKWKARGIIVFSCILDFIKGKIGISGLKIRVSMSLSQSLHAT